MKVYLVNTLNDIANQNFHQLSFEGMGETIANESLEASKVKRTEPIMIVIGNPPYSIQSQNLTKSARA